MLVVFIIEIFNFVLQQFWILNILLDFIWDLHPWRLIILKFVNKEDLINIDKCWWILALIHFLNMLDKPLEFVVSEQLINIFLNSIHDWVPVLALNNIWIGIWPDNLDNIVFLTESFIDEKVG